MNENNFNTNYEVSRRLGLVTEEFGADLLSLAKNTCGVRMRDIPKWKIEMVVSDGLLRCMELFYDTDYKISNPINFFHTAIDNIASNYIKLVYRSGAADAFGCSLVVNRNNGTATGKSINAKQINNSDGYIG